MNMRITSILFLAILLSTTTDAFPCWSCALVDPTMCIGSSPSVWDYCYAYSAAGSGTCYPHGSVNTWVCSSCPPQHEAQCADYGIEYVCLKDYCKAGGMKKCNWTVTGTGGYCSAGCGGRTVAACRGEAGNQSGCLPEYDSSLNFKRCIDCPIGHECGDYAHGVDCGINTCKVSGACIWWGDSCVADADGDGCPDEEDNCPGIKNMDLPSRDMNNTYCDVGENCDREGDACDDTDGDGLTDQFEKDHAADGQDPVNTDANENCIPDGVEYGFGPLIGMLKKIGVAVGTLMLAYLGVGWLTADTPAKRDNAKKGSMYIIAGLLLLVGTNNLVIFLLQGTCTRPPNVGVSCSSSCTQACPTAPTGGGSSPFIYSFNGTSFILEHDAFPFAVLPAWEYETFSRLEHVRDIDGFYRVRLAEERSYTTYANNVRFLVVDHPGDVSVLPDLSGRVRTLGALVAPVSCVEEDGTDCMEWMIDDDQYWRSSTDDKRLLDTDKDGVIDEYDKDDLFDGIMLSFPNPGNSEQAKLVVKVRETGAVDLAWHKLLELLGKDTAEKLMQLSGDRRLAGLISSLKVREALYHVKVWSAGEWVPVESFGVGPNTPYEFVIPLTVPAEDEVKIKIESAVLAYETDYIVIDYTEDAETRVTELAPSRVELPNHKVDSEALRIISSDDEEYLPLTRGNYVDVYFKTPEDAGDARTVIVGMKGYYVTHVNTEGERSLDSLGKMTKFILDPTYAIRYTYPKYLRSHWNEENT